VLSLANQNPKNSMGPNYSTHETFVELVKNGDLDGVVGCFQPEYLEQPGDFQIKPIIFACYYEDKGIARYLIDHICDIECDLSAYQRWRPIHFACANGYFGIVKFLIDHGCNLDCQTVSGWRPIHHAYANGHLDIVKFLIDHNCDINCMTNSGWQPIHFACRGGHDNIAKLLINHNCHVECETNMKCRPIHHACASGFLDIVKLLVCNKCDFDCDSLSGWTPIHHACASGHFEIVKFLYDRNCDLECESFSGWRPIHHACAIGHVQIAKFLIDHHCDVECKTDMGWKPIHAACFSGHVDIVKLLVRNRCELQCKNEDGFTPLDLAILEEHQACRDFLAEAVKLAQFFECIRRNQCEILQGLNTGDILTREEPGTGLSFLEVAVQSKATEVIKAFLDKRVDDEEIGPLKNYIKICSRPVAVELIQESLLDRSIRYSHVGGFQMSILPDIVNRQRNIISSSFLEIAAEFGTRAFMDEILQKRIYNEEELARAKDLAISKGHIDIVDGISARENQERQILEGIISKTSEDMIMISYCHNDEQIVKRIYQDLDTRGYKVWIDFKNMGNKIYRDMSLAVEQSKVIIVCGSSSYQSSESCERELSYALQHKKCIVPLIVEMGYKPAGWLGINLAPLQRLNMCGKYDFETSMSKLMEHLDSHIIIKYIRNREEL